MLGLIAHIFACGGPRGALAAAGALLLATVGCSAGAAAPVVEKCPVLRTDPATLPERIWLPSAAPDALSLSVYHVNMRLSPADCGITVRSTDERVLRAAALAAGPGRVELQLTGAQAGTATVLLSLGATRRETIAAAVTDSQTLLLSVAHRGAGLHAPENTMAAMRLAAQFPVPGVEFDVRLTSDSVPILMHDITFERTTGYPATVAETPYAVSQALNAVRFSPTPLPAEPPPALAAVLHFLGTTEIPLVLAEIKHDDAFPPEVEAARALEAARGSGLGERLVFYSGSTQVLRALRAQDSTIMLGFMAPQLLSTQSSFLKKYDIRYMVYPFEVFSAANGAVLNELRAGGVRLVGYTAKQLTEADSFVRAQPGTLVVADSVPALFASPIVRSVASPIDTLP